jgi:autotransporter strand-loop-strand O-heptosyltransferase
MVEHRSARRYDLIAWMRTKWERPYAMADEENCVGATDNPKSAGERSGRVASKPAYPPLPQAPTLDVGNGIRLNFNCGARVVVPKRNDGAWRVRLCDLDTGNVLFESENRGAYVLPTKRYFVRFRVEIWDVRSDDGVKECVVDHAYEARDRDVVIVFPVGTLGDTLGWFPYAARFASVHGCRLICAMSGLIIPLLQKNYPHIRFVTHEELVRQKLDQGAYATYRLGLFFDDQENAWQPCDFRLVGLHRTAAYILGVDPAEEAPCVAIADGTRPITEPYVCIAVQSSSACKQWHNPHG